MEKVIKIQSENSVVQTFDNSATFPSQKLFDFKIPRGEVYDLSASYVAINIEPVVTTNPAINGIIPVVRVVSGVVTNANIAGYPAGSVNRAMFLLRLMLRLELLMERQLLLPLQHELMKTHIMMGLSVWVKLSE